MKGESGPTRIGEHDARLRAAVHPSDWTNPEPAERYDLVVLGAGTAGLVTAAGAAGLGARVALVERGLMGGDCLNVGCVPSKALLRCARAAADVRDAGRFGVVVEGGVRVDFPAVMERMRRLRADLAPIDGAPRFRDLGVDVFLGEGRFTARDRLEVAGRELRFKRAVVATGARAVAPPIPGLDETGSLTNETVFDLTELPPRLAVVGGGPIGCELAQAFARFGAEVTLLEMGEAILGREDRDAAARVHAALETDGVRIRCKTKVVGARRSDGAKALALEGSEGAEELAVDAVLVGVGRAPNVEGLGLEAAGVEYDRQGVRVDDRLRTTNPRVFAAGDVATRYKFTHTADATARIVIQNALFFGRARTSALVVPWCTYTDPELAHVGKSADEAREQGLEIDTYTVDLAEVDRARLDGEDGLLKVHVEKGKDTIVGATLVARHAGETISELTLAMVAGAGLGTLAKTIHPYPTQADALRRAGDAYNKTRLTPLVAKLLEWIVRLRR